MKLGNNILENFSYLQVFLSPCTPKYRNEISAYLHQQFHNMTRNNVLFSSFCSLTMHTRLWHSSSNHRIDNSKKYFEVDIPTIYKILHNSCLNNSKKKQNIKTVSSWTKNIHTSTLTWELVKKKKSWKDFQQNFLIMEGLSTISIQMERL